MNKKPLAVQLYSVREELAVGWDAVFRRIADIGYIGVEPYFGLDAKQVLESCRQHNLQITSCHLPLLDDAVIEEALATATSWGVTEVVMPWQPAERFTTVDDVEAVCAEMNAILPKVQANGFHLGYHNHDFEFTSIGEQTAFDIMRNNLHPDIFFEVDTYWVEIGKVDAAKLVQDLGSRAPLLHIKDGMLESNESMVAVGTGNMDYAAILGAAGDHPKWLIVELDRCETDMLDAIEQSYQYLTQQGWGYGNA